MSILRFLRRALTRPATPPQDHHAPYSGLPQTDPATIIPIQPATGRGELAQILHHHAPKGLVAARMVFAPITTSAAERAHATRVMRAFHHAMNEQATQSQLPVHDVWEGVAGAFHQECLDILRRESVDELTSLLASAYRKPITHGLGPGQAVFEAASTPDGNAAIATICMDRLAALAEALGVVPCENPEQGRWGQNLYLDPVELSRRIAEVCGTSITPNQAMGCFGIQVDGGVFFARAADHIYAAHRCRALGATRVIEIGGGLAGIGDYLLRFGATSYDVYDLPIMNVVQGYALLTAGHTVSLLGEPDGPVRVRPWWHLATAAPCDVVVNQDSFPEIDGTFVRSYLQQIAKTSACFLSINQEGEAAANADGVLQHVVGRLAAETPGLTRISRAPYWIRKGYVEEVWLTSRP